MYIAATQAQSKDQIDHKPTLLAQVPKVCKYDATCSARHCLSTRALHSAIPHDGGVNASKDCRLTVSL